MVRGLNRVATIICFLIPVQISTFISTFQSWINMNIMRFEMPIENRNESGPFNPFCWIARALILLAHTWSSTSETAKTAWKERNSTRKMSFWAHRGRRTPGLSNKESSASCCIVYYRIDFDEQTKFPALFESICIDNNLHVQLQYNKIKVPLPSWFSKPFTVGRNVQLNLYSVAVIWYSLPLRYTSAQVYQKLLKEFPLPSFSCLKKIMCGGIDSLKALKKLREVGKILMISFSWLTKCIYRRHQSGKAGRMRMGIYSKLLWRSWSLVWNHPHRM